MICLGKICLNKTRLLVISILLLFFLSCSYRESVDFWKGPDTTVLYALSKNAESGILPFTRNAKLEYMVSGLNNLQNDYSLEISYQVIDTGTVTIPGLAAIDLDGTSWVLPWDFSFLDSTVLPEIYRDLEFLTIKYTIPLSSRELENLTLFWMHETTATVSGNTASGSTASTGTQTPSLVISNIELVPRWFGVSFNIDTRTLKLSPFVYSQGNLLVMEIPPMFDYSFESSALDNSDIAAANAALESTSSGSIQPITADTRQVLNWPLSEWRLTNYELFRWSDFPHVLIFDFLNYDVQNRFLKRLAFFVEKAGFRGRLAQDHEIANLHG